MAYSQPAGQYGQWLTAKRSRNAAYLAAAAERKAAPRSHPARMLAFADGSSGYGRYKRRRTSYRAPAARYRRFRGRTHGRGGFWGDLWGGVKKGLSFIPRGTFAGIGGRAFGPGGALAGKALSTLSGYGAYGDGDAGNNRQRDQSDVVDQDVPQMSNPSGTDGGVMIRHREFIGDIISTGPAFTIQSQLAINPGLPASFPWLYSIAGNYSQYKMEGMMFEFVSTSGAQSTSQGLGEVIMCVNYNAGGPAITNKSQMLNQIMAVSKVPSENAICAVETSPGQTPVEQQYIRTTNLPSGQDPRFYDLGVFTLATQGQAAGCTLGELWVTYQVELFKPVLASPSGALHLLSAPVGGSSAANFGGAAGFSLTPSSTLPGVIVNSASTSNSLQFSTTFPSGTRILLTAITSGTLISGNFAVSSGGQTFANIFHSDAGYTSQNNSATAAQWIGAFTVSSSPQYWTVVAPPGLTGGDSDVFLTVLPAQLT
jgi:hypothetical protein